VKKLIILIGGGLAIIVLIIMLVVSLTGQKQTSASTLNFVTYGENVKGLQALVVPFEKTNNVKVNFVKKALTSDYELDSLNSISTGQVDVWGIPNTWLPKHLDKSTAFNYDYKTNKINQNILSAYQNVYPVSIVQGNVFNEKIYGLPLSLDALVLFRNNAVVSQISYDSSQNLTYEQKKLLSETPANWADLTAQAKILTKKDGDKITQSGLAMGTADLPAASDILTLLMQQYGTQMTNDAQSEATFQTSLNQFGGPAYPGAKALDFYTSFAKKDNPNYSFSTSLGDPIRAFADGKIAYYVDYASKAIDINFINSKLGYAIYAVPQLIETRNPVDYIAYETFTVPKTSKNQDLAWSLLDYLTDPSNSRVDIYFDSASEIPAFITTKPSGVIGVAAQKAVAWYNPEATETDKIFRQVISDVLSGANAQTALEAAAVKVTNLLKKIQ